MIFTYVYIYICTYTFVHIHIVLCFGIQAYSNYLHLYIYTHLRIYTTGETQPAKNVHGAPKTCRANRTRGFPLVSISFCRRWWNLTAVMVLLGRGSALVAFSYTTALWSQVGKWNTWTFEFLWINFKRDHGEELCGIFMNLQVSWSADTIHTLGLFTSDSILFISCDVWIWYFLCRISLILCDKFGHSMAKCNNPFSCHTQNLSSRAYFNCLFKEQHPRISLGWVVEFTQHQCWINAFHNSMLFDVNIVDGQKL